MKPAISQVCTLRSPFEKDVEDFAAGACGAIEIWLGKLETYLESHTVDDVRALLDRHEMAAPVASFQGGLFTRSEEARREHWAHFRRRLELCQKLGVATLVIVADVAGPLERPDVEQVTQSLAEAANAAGEHDVRLALEFQARSALGNNLETAAALVAECGSPHLGLCLDVFHYHAGPSKTEDLAYVTRDNLFHVQLSDLVGTLREFAADADRILPGDGEVPLGTLVEHLRRIGYEGYVSLEVMNPNIWAVPARQVGEIGMTAMRTALGIAAME